MSDNASERKRSQMLQNRQRELILFCYSNHSFFIVKLFHHLIEKNNAALLLFLMKLFLHIYSFQWSEDSCFCVFCISLIWASISWIMELKNVFVIINLMGHFHIVLILDRRQQPVWRSRQEKCLKDLTIWFSINLNQNKVQPNVKVSLVFNFSIYLN